MAEFGLGLALADPSAVERSILLALADRLTAALRTAAPRIKSGIGPLVKAALLAAPEVDSLLAGQLKGELGVADAGPVVAAVAEAVAAGVMVTASPARLSAGNVQAELVVELVRSDYQDVLAVAGAEFRSEGRYQIPWLRWLTLEGDRLLVTDFRFAAGAGARSGPRGGLSRTGLGLMVRGGTWRVPPEFSGVQGDNWITRALVAALPGLTELAAAELARSF